MTSDAIAGAIFIVLGVLLVLAPHHMLRVNAYIMVTGGAPDDHDRGDDNLIVTRAIGVLFIVVGLSILY